MLILSGQVRRIIERSYQNKEAKTVKTFDIDVLHDDDRFPVTVNFRKLPDFQEGDNVEIPVKVYAYNTKEGKPFIKFNAVTEEVVNDK